MPHQKLNLPQSWVLMIAFLTLLIPLLILEYPLLQYSKGIFIYPQDEAYIRMATAKGLAFHGVWGLSGQEFNSASSSILYPMILAVLYKLFGTHLLFPFLINLLAAVVCIMVFKRWLLRQGLTPISQALTLAAIILLTPLHVLVAGGMEHMLQVLFTILFIIKFCEWLAAEGQQDHKRRTLPWNIYALGILMTATRYEGLFVVLVTCMALLIKRKPLLCITFGLVSALPVIFFGIYALHKNAYFLPNSLMMKAIPVPLDGDAVQRFFKDDLFIRLIYPYNTPGSIAATRLLIVLPLLYWLVFHHLCEQTLYRNMLLFSLAVTILHLAFVNVVLFFRYEAYLIACAAFITSILIAQYKGARLPQRSGLARWMVVWTSVLLLYPFFSRSWTAHEEAFSACLNTYEQSFAAAGFVHQYYNEATVITDDIGATSYLNEGKIMDLSSGIGYMEIARSREGSYLRVEYADYLIKQERPLLAIINENKYGRGLLQHWVKIAEWYTNNKIVSRDTHLSIYSLDSLSSPVLKERLQAYEPSLPSAVKVVYP